MNLSQLYYFRKLAELQHYGKASKELYITQPSLSNSIGNLEKELGVPLFERVGRNVRLTSYGVEFNEHICVALNEIDKAVDLMQLTSNGLSGSIRIGTVISIQRTYLPQLMRSFRERHGSKVVFDVYQETTYSCLQGLEDGRFDVVFCGKVTDHHDIEFVPVLTQDLVAAVDESHPLAGRESVTFSELADYGIITYRGESYMGIVIKDLLQRLGLQASSSFDDEISACTLVVAEKNVVALMLDTLDDDSFKGISIVPISDMTEAFHTVYLAYKPKSFHSCATERFIDFTAQTCPMAEPAAPAK